MIPNPHACYDRSARDVVAWSDEGKALVIDCKSGRLVEAIGPLTANTTPTALIPGTGWQVIYGVGTPDEWREPLVAWGITTDGVAPFVTDPYGLVDVLAGDNARILPTDVADRLAIAEVGENL